MVQNTGRTRTTTQATGSAMTNITTRKRSRNGRSQNARTAQRISHGIDIAEQRVPRRGRSALDLDERQCHHFVEQPASDGDVDPEGDGLQDAGPRQSHAKIEGDDDDHADDEA